MCKIQHDHKFSPILGWKQQKICQLKKVDAFSGEKRMFECLTLFVVVQSHTNLLLKEENMVLTVVELWNRVSQVSPWQDTCHLLMRIVTQGYGRTEKN